MLTKRRTDGKYQLTHPKPLLHTHPWQLIERVHREHTAPDQIHSAATDWVICREVPGCHGVAPALQFFFDLLEDQFAELGAGEKGVSGHGHRSK